MSGEKTWRASNIEGFLRALSAQAGVKCGLGSAADNDQRLAGRLAVVWTPREDSGQIRECTCGYDRLQVFYEFSLLYDVHMRGSDMLGAIAMMRRISNAMVAIGATSPGVEFTDTFSVGESKVANEPGSVIIWPIRVWEPLVYAEYIDGHITTVTSAVNVTDSEDNVTGTVP